ncbi:hypothetical protein HT031_006004 [Scenedesmus sp. PABB004]|nr:hypothetical protein HT031_006004 [Scenedesmus sp. PABB004]
MALVAQRPLGIGRGLPAPRRALLAPLLPRAAAAAWPGARAVPGLVPGQRRTPPAAPARPRAPPPRAGEGEGDSSPPPPPGAGASAGAWLRRLLAAALRGLAGLALLVGIAPYVLSSAWGTAAVAGAAGRVLPGRVALRKVQLGWGQPIVIEGLAVHEGRAPDSRQLLGLERLSSAGAAHAAGRAGAGRGAAARQRGAQLPPPPPPPPRLRQSRCTPCAGAGASRASEAAGAEDGGEGAGARPGGGLSALRHALTQADAVAHVSAELRLPQLSVYMPDAQLLLPEEVRAAVGEHIHAVAAIGRQQVLELAEELDEDVSWLQLQQQQPPAGPAQAQRDGAAATQQDEQQGEQQQPLPSWPLPPPGVAAREWQQAPPAMLQVSGDNVSALLRGWALSTRSFVLQQPATAEWCFTPELARLTLSVFNPLLEGVTALRERGSVATAFAPAGGLLPAPRGQASLHVAPLKLVMGEGQLLRDIQRLLHMSEHAGLLRHGWLPGGAPRGVEVWTGPLVVDVEGPQRFTTRRTDMLVGARRALGAVSAPRRPCAGADRRARVRRRAPPPPPPLARRAAGSGGAALHLALWGGVDLAAGGSLDMRLGLPAATLARAGIRGLAPSYLLPLAVRGKLTAPHVDWPAAARKLAVLSAMQVGRGALGAGGGGGGGGGAAAPQQAAGGAGILGAATRALSSATSAFVGQVDQRLQEELRQEAPPPPARLPWEKQQQQHPLVPPPQAGR